MKRFSDNMRYLRKINNLSQPEIQSILGIEQTTWSNYERGKSFPNLKLFHKICKYFGVSETDLLNSDLENDNLIKNKPAKKIRENDNLNDNLNGNLMKENEEELMLRDMIRTQKIAIESLQYHIHANETIINSQKAQIEQLSAKLEQLKNQSNSKEKSKEKKRAS